jgi:hypothetical protein
VHPALRQGHELRRDRQGEGRLLAGAAPEGLRPAVRVPTVFADVRAARIFQEIFGWSSNHQFDPTRRPRLLTASYGLALPLDQRPDPRPHLRPERGAGMVWLNSQRPRPPHAVRREGARTRPRGRLPLDRLHTDQQAVHISLGPSTPGWTSQAGELRPGAPPRHRPLRLCRAVVTDLAIPFYVDVLGLTVTEEGEARSTCALEVHPPQPGASAGPGRGRGRAGVPGADPGTSTAETTTGARCRTQRSRRFVRSATRSGRPAGFLRFFYGSARQRLAWRYDLYTPGRWCASTTSTGHPRCRASNTWGSASG